MDTETIQIETTAKDLRSFTGFLACLTDEARLRVNHAGIHAKCVDPAHVAMVETTLGAGTLHEAREVGIDVAQLHKVAKAMPVKGAPVTLAFRETDLLIQRGPMETTIPLLDHAGITDPKVPNLELPGVAHIDVPNVLAALKAAGQVSDHVTVTLGGETPTLQIRAHNTDTNAETRYTDQLAHWQGDGQKSLYSLDYLESMIRAIKNTGAQTAQIHLGNDYPIRIWTEAHNLEATYLLAPRIET